MGFMGFMAFMGFIGFRASNPQRHPVVSASSGNREPRIHCTELYAVCLNPKPYTLHPKP